MKSPEDIFDGYDKDKLTVTTLGSHSALQVLQGARVLGFKSLVLCE